MAYELVDNFAAGLDNRKSPLTAPSGTLTTLINAVVNPGGELEKRRAFVKVADVTNSFGLVTTGTTMTVFGRNVTPDAPVLTTDGNLLAADGVLINTMLIPNGDASLQQTDYDIFDGKIYLACSTGVAFGGKLPDVPTAAQNPHYFESVPGTFVLTTTGSAKGFYVRTYQSKMYGVVNKLLNFSAVNDPMIWDTGTGHGFINLSLQDASSELLTSLEVYYDKLAVFTTKSVQLWAVDPDPLQNAFTQLLRDAGTTGPRSPLQYGSGDVLYLDQSGVRSLKAKDSSNSAAVSDIGSPIDPHVRTMRATHDKQYMNRAISLLEPSVGRFWMIFPDHVLALSYFPGPGITAWSELTIPEIGGATVTYAVTCGGYIFIRTSNDQIWVYGGYDHNTYNNCGVEVWLPYLNGKKPGHNKIFEAVDLTIQGIWSVGVSYDFNNPVAEELVGTFSKSTWNGGRAELTGMSSHISLRLRNNDMAAATLSNIAVHYQVVDDEA